MRLTGTITIVNSLAHSQGYGASSKLGRPCKCVLQIRKRGDGRDVLVLSTRTDIGGREYDVRNIAVLRTMFVNEGRATIEIKEPPMNLMMRDCKPEELMAFMDDLKKLHAGKKLIVTSAPNNSNAQNAVPQNENQETLESLRKGRPTKRARSPELSKNEKTKIKRTLEASSQTISVKDRAKYPKEILRTIERIFIQGIKLRKIDQRFFKLKWLHTLDLRGNSIEEITEQLTKLSSFLQSLVLAKNRVAEIPDDLFNAPTFQKLQHLDLSGNKLTKLPNSILNLQTLTSLYINDNEMSYLPYNWMDSKSLRVLNVAENKLLFVPATLLYLHLTSFDMSGNQELQRSDNMDPDYVGFSCVPTLFEMASEVVMNVQRNNKIHPNENASLPSIIQSYLQGGKFCIECSTKTLRYKIIKGSVLPSSFNRGTMSACEVSPALSSCFIKKIICPACDSKYRNSRVSKLI